MTNFFELFGKFNPMRNVEKHNHEYHTKFGEDVKCIVDSCDEVLTWAECQSMFYSSDIPSDSDLPLKDYPRESFLDGVMTERNDILSFLKDERMQWGSGTTASRLIDGFINYVQNRPIPEEDK